MEEFQKIQSLQAEIQGTTVVNIQIPTIEVVETEEQAQERIDNINIVIKIPLYCVNTPLLQDKVSQMIFLFSGLQREVDGEYFVLSNIKVKHLKRFLTQDEFKVFDSR
jgi:hypothetical protein